jgi:hypothetical protein
MSIEAEAYPRQGLAVPAANSDRNSQIVITVTPDRAPGRYRAHLETELKPLCVSCQPFFDGARTLIARGHGPRTMLVMRWAGSKGWMLRGPLVVAAKLTVDEHNGTVFAKWKPLSRSAGSPRIAKSADTGSRDQRLLNAIADSTAENAGERAPLARRLVKSADPHPTTETRADSNGDDEDSDCSRKG